MVETQALGRNHCYIYRWAQAQMFPAVSLSYGAVPNLISHSKDISKRASLRPPGE